jgi:hypothetical protein
VLRDTDPNAPDVPAFDDPGRAAAEHADAVQLQGLHAARDIRGPAGGMQLRGVTLVGCDDGLAS